MGRTRKGAVVETRNDALYGEIGRLKVELDWLRKKGNCTGRHPVEGCLRREDRDLVWRCRLPERYSVLPAGMKGLPRKTRRKASRALIPFLRSVET